MKNKSRQRPRALSGFSAEPGPIAHGLIAAALMIALPASAPLAQSIEVTAMGSAQSYDPGVFDAQNGGLGSNLWQSTSAAIAAQLLDNMPAYAPDSMGAKLSRMALLSGGAPPAASAPVQLARYHSARIDAVMTRGEIAAAQIILERSGGPGANPQLAAELALLRGDNEGACTISDGVMTERTQAGWVKLRGFCHAVRDEGPAAELTADLLKSSGVKDPAYFSLLDKLVGLPAKPKLGKTPPEPLYLAMANAAGISWPGDMPPALAAMTARSPDSKAEDRLKALYRAQWALGDEDMLAVMKELTALGDDALLAGGSSYDLTAALTVSAPSAPGMLYQIAEMGSPGERLRACGELLARADKEAGFDRFSALLTPLLQSLPLDMAEDQDLPFLLKAAVGRGDLSAMQSLYSSFQDRPKLQARIALAADALGNGFYAGKLGQDIDDRLSQDDKEIIARARRDAVTAFALGAQLSEPAIKAMMSSSQNAKFQMDIIPLKAAAQKRASAETALRAAMQLGSRDLGALDDLTFYELISTLYGAGLTDLAGQIAAIDILSDLPELKTQ